MRDTIKERESYARLNGKNVITLNVVKRAGENLIETAAGVDEIVAELKEDIVSARPGSGDHRRSKHQCPQLV